MSGLQRTLSHDTRDEDDQPKKRRKPVLSCLPCKRRKAKCDKSHPCSTCLARQEGHLCEYEHGISPPPQQGFVTMQEFMHLADRVARLEDASGGGGHTQEHRTQAEVDNHRKFSRAVTPPRLAIPHKAIRSDGMLENAFIALEGVAAHAAYFQDTYENNEHPDHYQSGNGGVLAHGDGAARWPSIILPSDNQPRTAWWVNTMTDIVAVIPPKPVLSFLIDYFFAEDVGYRPALHRIVFLEELKQFEALREQGLALSIDPAWLALLSAAICLAASSLSHESNVSAISRSVGIDAVRAAEIAAQVSVMTDPALTCANWVFKPQLRVLLTLLLAMPLLGTRSQGHTKLAKQSDCMYLEVGVGISRRLGLHKLGLDAQPRLPADLMLPPHLPVYSLEICKRAYATVVIFDTFAFCKVTNPAESVGLSLIPTDSVTATVPLNYLDEDLLRPDPVPLPMTKPSPALWNIHRYRCAVHWRKVYNLLGSGGELSYDAVLELDNGLQADLAELRQLRSDEGFSDFDEINMILAASGYMQRVIRLHRPFLMRRCPADSFKYSRLAAHTAARQIVQGHKRLMRHYGHRPMVSDALFIWLHHLSAVIILFAIAIHEPITRLEILEELESSMRLFEGVHADGTVNAQFAGRGKRAIAAMLKLLERNPSPDDVQFDAFLREIQRCATSDEGNTPSSRTAASHRPSPVTPSTLVGSDPRVGSKPLKPADLWGAQSGVPEGGAIDLGPPAQNPFETWNVGDGEEWLKGLASIDIDWEALLRGM